LTKVDLHLTGGEEKEARAGGLGRERNHGGGEGCLPEINQLAKLMM